MEAHALSPRPAVHSPLLNDKKVGASLLAGSERTQNTDEHIRQLLESINEVTARLQT
jgi:hypothetical protein